MLVFRSNLIGKKRKWHSKRIERSQYNINNSVGDHRLTSSSRKEKNNQIDRYYPLYLITRDFNLQDIEGTY
jgi:hypothetical protein